MQLLNAFFFFVNLKLSCAALFVQFHYKYILRKTSPIKYKVYGNIASSPNLQHI